MFLDYVRTDKGREELKKRSRRLNARQRALLLIIEQASTESQSISQPWEHLATVENINCLLELDFIQSAQQALSSTNSSAAVEVANVATSENLSSTFDSSQIISSAKDKLIQPQPSTAAVVDILEPTVAEVVVVSADELIVAPELPVPEIEVAVLDSEPTIEPAQAPFILVDEVVADSTDELLAHSELPALETEVTVLDSEPTIEPAQLPLIPVEEALESSANEVVADSTDELIVAPELPVPEIEAAVLDSEPPLESEQVSLIPVEEVLESSADELVADSTDELLAHSELLALETQVAVLGSEPMIEPAQAPLILVEEILESNADEVVADSTDDLIADPELPAPETEVAVLDSERCIESDQTSHILVEEVLESSADELVVSSHDDTVDVIEEESTFVIKSPEELLIDDFEQSLTHLKNQPVVSKEAVVVCSAKKTPNLMDDEEDFLVADEILINGKKPRYDAIPVLTWQVEES